ncbi:MAG TPA: histidine phosphatase family protein [Candidatus Dormibacteraeota bacterium]|nr:histidine phosphatase family protein [Candidatus Dormibacteraeota bacterium]
MSDEVPTEPMDDQTPTATEPTPETRADTAPTTEAEHEGEQSPFTDVEPALPAQADDEPAPRTEADAELAPADEAAPAPEAAPVAVERAAPVTLELYFLRHADAGDPMAWQGDDADRPLSRKGRRQSKALMRLLDDLHLQVDAVLTSPKLRAADTARIVAKAVGTKAHADDRLSLDFGEDTLAALVAEWGPGVRRVILVGHDPDFSHLVSWLAGTSITMRKGALARLDLADRSVGAGHGSLRWLLPPDAVAG